MTAAAMPAFAPDTLAAWTGGRWTRPPSGAIAGFTQDTRTLGAGQLSMLLCESRGDPIREAHYLRTLIARRVDGIIVTGRFVNSKVEDLHKVMKGCIEVPYHFLRAVVPVMVGVLSLLLSGASTVIFGAVKSVAFVVSTSVAVLPALSLTVALKL